MSPAPVENAPPPNGDGSPPLFSELVTSARLRKGWSQHKLASELGKTKQWINGIEKNDLPSIEQVVRLHDVLLDVGRRLPEPESTRSLGYWLVSWLAQHAERRPSAGTDRMSKALRQALPLFPNAFATKKPSPLSSFPSAFERLTIIAGDRREAPPHSGGDLFAGSASMLDLRYLNALRLGTRDVPIWHDKVLVQMSDDYLRRQFGNSNLLVIGSPAVNLAARRINGQSLFRFNISAEARASDAQARATFPRPDTFSDRTRLAVDREKGTFRLQDRRDVAVLGGVLRALECGDQTFDAKKYLEEDESKWYEGHYAGTPGVALEEQGRSPSPGDVFAAARAVLGDDTPSAWARRFRPLEIADPAEGRLHRLDGDPAERLYKDLAVVSLGANPFADEEDGYVSILVAGIHGPGTAHAVKALAEQNFDQRPLGGVFEVALVPNVNLPQRVIEAKCEWLTGSYGREKIETTLTRSPSDLAREWGEELDDWTVLAHRLFDIFGIDV